MASSSISSSKLADRWADITLEDEDDGGLVFEETELPATEGEGDLRWGLVARLMSDRPIDGEAFKHRMAYLWRPGKGMYVKELGPNLFLFQFFHEVDMQRVVEGSPWTFNNVPLIIDRVNRGDNPQDIPLFNLSLWVQVYDLRPGFKSEKLLTDIGNYLGSYITSCPKNFMGLWRDYLRVRVAIDTRKPLKRRMKIRRGNEEFWATFKYERLPQFCFICGMLGHTDKYCEKFFDTPVENIIKPYGAWMRAPDRRKSKQIGAKWLRDSAWEENPGSENDGCQGKHADPVGNRGEKDIIESCNSEPHAHGRTNCLQRDIRDRMEIEINDQSLIGHSTSTKTDRQPLESEIEGVLNVMDPKRRRVQEGVETNQIELYWTSSEVGLDEENQKNLQMAGPAAQARQES